MEIITASTSTDHYKTVITAGENTIIVDEPVERGGKNYGLNPGELLAASVASCTSITLRMYADRKGWALHTAMIETTFDHNHEAPRMTISVGLEGNLDEAQRQRLLQVASRCPIHKLLESSMLIETISADA